MNNPDTSGTVPQSPVFAAIRHMLRPLVRLLLLHGISFTIFCELVKTAYVKVADAEFRLDAKPQTDSRISLLTGIHRREVNRLRKRNGDRDQPAPACIHECPAIDHLERSSRLPGRAGIAHSLAAPGKQDRRTLL